MFIAETFNKTTATVKYLEDGEQRVATQSVNGRLMGSMLRRLVQELQWSYEVWGQQNSSRDGQWEVVSRGSPGNFEEWEGDEEGDNVNALNNNNHGNNNNANQQLMAAVHVSKDHSAAQSAVKGAAGLVTVGVAYVDSLNGEMGVAQFPDEEDTLTNLESFLVQFGCRECVACPSNTYAKALASVLARSDVAFTERPAQEFKTGTLTQDLELLLKAQTLQVSAMPELQLTNAMAALSSLIKHLNLLADTGLHGKFALRQVSLKEYMRLDAAAVSSLNLLPGPNDSAKSMNLYGRLNTCLTAMGCRKLMQWIRQPLLDVDLITRRQDVVAALVGDTTLRVWLQQEGLKRIPDLQRLLLRFSKKKAGLQDVVRLYQAVQCLPAMAQAVDGAQDTLVKERYGAAITRAIEDFARFGCMVESTMDLDALEEGQYRIKPSFDASLEELSQGLKAAMNTMKKELDRVIRSTGVKKAEMELKKGSGYCMRVVKKEKKTVEENMQGTLEDVANTTKGWYFRTTAFADAARKHDKLSEKYDEIQKQLVDGLLEVVAGYGQAIVDLQELLSDLDVYAALAHAACSAPKAYVRPKLTPCGVGDTVLVQARHPCLECQDGVTYIPNDVRFERGSRELLIITGPNMGGKSTYIRATGMIVLMAQIGCFVPCDSATVSLADTILCRVGAGDSQLRGVSTFMAEMLETAHILRSATSASLLIIDELGRGTSTYDGFGLAFAIAEHIAKKIRPFAFFATHFHELTSLSHSVATVANQHVSAKTDKDNLVLLYNVREGPCDQSFGIHVAELAKFPPKVVAMAKRKAQQLESFQQQQAAQGAKRTREGEEDGGAAPDEQDAKARKEGEQQIVGFLETYKSLEKAHDAAKRIQDLKSELVGKGNPYVLNLIKKIEETSAVASD